MHRTVPVVAAALTSAACGQVNSYLIIASNEISPESPSATIEVWSTFDPAWYALNGADFDLFATADPGEFSNPERVLDGPGTKDGVVGPGGDSVEGIIVGQLHFPSSAGIFADTANPILAWTATWSTTDFTPRTVDLYTLTRKYFLYLNDTGYAKDFRDDPSFGEAFGQIVVVPSPGVLAPLVLLPGLWRRRR